MEVLFIDSCVRPKEISRTYALADHFIRAYEARNPTHRISRLDLSASRLSPLTHDDILMRDKGEWSKSHYTRQFARSDKIVVAAPVWDLGGPSLLRVYIEYICLLGVTFECIEDRYTGLCAAKKALHISTMGGCLNPGDTTGAEYVQAVFARLGVGGFDHICAEGIDIEGNDAEKLLKDAMDQCEKLAESW